MANKDKFKPHQDKKFNQAKGRRDGSTGKTSQQQTNRERNVGHKKAEEHSLRPKGNRG